MQLLLLLLLQLLLLLLRRMECSDLQGPHEVRGWGRRQKSEERWGPLGGRGAPKTGYMECSCLIKQEKESLQRHRRPREDKEIDCCERGCGVQGS